MRALIVLVILITVALLVPVPVGGRVAGCLQNSMHVPVFALVGAVVFLVLDSRFKMSRILTMLVSWAMTIGFGIATEVMQSFVERDFSWHDVWADTCGGLVGIVLVGSLSSDTPGRRAGLIVLGSMTFLIGMADPLLRLTDAVIQQQEMPTVASFESPLELFRWQFGDCQANRVQQHATDGRWSLQVDLQVGQYPGVALAHPVPDWSDYRELVIDVFLTDGRPLDITVKIKDADHNEDYYDRFHRVVHLLPGENEILVLLADVADAPQGRQMDLRRIAGLSLFTVSPSQPRTFFLDNIRLR